MTLSTPKTRREKEIWEACDSLYAELGNVDKIIGDLIFNRLLELEYKKGSPNEIYRYRRSWKTARGFDVQKTENSPLTFSDPISRAVQMVREEIMTEAKQQLDALRAEYENKLQPLEKDYARTKEELLSCIEKNDALERESNIAKATIAFLEKENQQTAQDQHILAMQLEHTSQKLAEQKNHYEQLLTKSEGQSQQRITQLEQQYAQNLSAWQSDASEYKALLEKQRIDMMLKYDVLKTSHEQLEKELQEAKLRESMATGLLEKRLIHMEELLIQSQTTIALLTQQHADLKEPLFTLLQEYQSLEDVPKYVHQILDELRRLEPPVLPKKKQRRHATTE